ncbi:MAG: glycoside hydrolase family 3 C-terminal domain-containing protein, partial [Brotaphodocola sp.]
YDFELTEDYTEADFALLFVRPSSGETFNATPGYLELDICTGKEVHDVDDDGRPIASTHLESTIENADQIKTISEAVHANHGQVISNVNFSLAWLVGNVEKYSDALLAGFETFTEATMDVILGEYNPTGRMPITLPKDDSVIEVDENGICVSHNDIPGYDKDLYMPDDMKDDNGHAYAYRDRAGNYYELGFGLSYNEEPEMPEKPDTPEEPQMPEKPDTPEEPQMPEKPGSNSNGHHSGGSGGNGNKGGSSSDGYESGKWVQSESGWWFEFTDGGWPQARWMRQPWAGKETWYYFSDAGYMQTGWIDYEGNRYYLHPLSDGNQGAMYTGWHQIDGVWYYFNEISDGTRGCLLKNTVTPDGYQVGADGAWIP